MNPGAENFALAEKAEEAGIEVVEGCTLVMLRSRPVLRARSASEEKLGVIDNVDQRQTDQNRREKLLERQLPAREGDHALLSQPHQENEAAKAHGRKMDRMKRVSLTIAWYHA